MHTLGTAAEWLENLASELDAAPRTMHIDRADDDECREVVEVTSRCLTQLASKARAIANDLRLQDDLQG